MVDSQKRTLIGLDVDDLTAALTALGLEKYRAKQVWSAVYCHGARDFDAITALSKPLRKKLSDVYSLDRPGVSVCQKSEDGTRKWLLRMADGNEVESVYIPEEDRGALCVSSQVGCLIGCRFCHTGTQKLVRDLDVSEIVGQVMVARDDLNDWPDPLAKESAPKIKGKQGCNEENPPLRAVSNIVMMGMGEPLYNYDNVAKALRIIMQSEGLGIGKRRITLSTSGVVPMIRRCGDELGINLAVSLHAVTDELRDQLVPINRKYPIKELLQACRDYPSASNSRRITFEYVMLKGVNDSMADAKQLVRLLRGIPAKINLIPFNPWPGSPFECSDWAVIQAFGDLVNAAGYASPVRMPRGRDIMAACGQLKSASQRAGAKKQTKEPGEASGD